MPLQSTGKNIFKEKEILCQDIILPTLLSSSYKKQGWFLQSTLNDITKIRASGPKPAQSWHFSQMPLCPPPQRWWRGILDATHAGSEHWPCQSCSPELSLWLMGPMHVAFQWWVCFHYLRSCVSVPHQQQYWSMGSLCDSRKQ